MRPQRHICLTAWLILLLIYNAIVVAIYSYQFAPIRELTSDALPIIVSPNASPLIIALVLLFATANIIFVFALFRWQRWGFYGYVITNVVVVACGLSFGYGKSIWSLVGIAILYLALNIGGNRKAWPNLK